MDKLMIQEAIYKKYIEPTKRNRQKSIGIEIEMPIINLQKESVDFEKVYELTSKFIKEFGFHEIKKDAEGHIYYAGDGKTGDILSFDCSYNNLEISMGKAEKISVLEERFQKYYRFIQQELEKSKYTLTGMGVNPYWKYNRNVPIPNGRYRMLFHHLQSYEKYHELPMYFHPYTEYGMSTDSGCNDSGCISSGIK